MAQTFRVDPGPQRLMYKSVDGQLNDSWCFGDPEGVHDVIMPTHRTFQEHVYECTACGYPAAYVSSMDLWVVTRPYLVFEEP